MAKSRKKKRQSEERDNHYNSSLEQDTAVDGQYSPYGDLDTEGQIDPSYQIDQTDNSSDWDGQEEAVQVW